MRNYEFVSLEFTSERCTSYTFTFYSYEYGIVKYSDIHLNLIPNGIETLYNVKLPTLPDLILSPFDTPGWFDAGSVEADAGKFPAKLWECVAEFIVDNPR